ncbi:MULTISPECIES: hypothetical protein [Bacteroidales]|uniref:hypothetical protein n=1 Tax=Bacteroidales TaxID=171549 RepID=UPI001C3FB188|nr:MULTISPECIES: hypothetical protein [Bacteroidaceae]MCE8858281.1 hypothetical protein [Phocaeicola dorei]
MKTILIYKLIYRLILWAVVVYFLTTTAGQFFALWLAVALFYFVARFILALVWRLFVGIVFILIIILLIL